MYIVLTYALDNRILILKNISAVSKYIHDKSILYSLQI